MDSSRSSPSPTHSPAGFAFTPLHNDDPPASSQAATPSSAQKRRPLRPSRPSFPNGPKPYRNGNSYMASASGSQTEGATDDEFDWTSESEAGSKSPKSPFRMGFTQLHEAPPKPSSDPVASTSAVAPNPALLVHGSEITRKLSGYGSAGAGSDTTRSGSPFAGDQGRGSSVLVEKKRQKQPAANNEQVQFSSLKPSSWAPALRGAIEERAASRRRPSPKPGARSSSKASTRQKPESPKSPPLRLVDLQSNFNPFALYHVRKDLVPELMLVLLAFLIGIWRTATLRPLVASLALPQIPVYSLLIVAAALPFVTLLRRPKHYFRTPFTDERGYRDPSLTDDGIATALVLPTLLALSVVWEAYRGHVGLEGIKPLVDVWSSEGLPAVTKGRFDVKQLVKPKQVQSAVLHSRAQLVHITLLNSGVLLLHLLLAATILRVEKVPRTNTKRFFGSLVLNTTISVVVYLLFKAWNLKSGNTPIAPMEAGLTTFVQQTCFYSIPRLARRGFSLGEMVVMVTGGNSLSLEFWRLSRARWFYKRGFPDIPPTFRSPSPIIVYQSVLIPGAFLCGFLLSPLLVLSRHLAQAPSHRIRWPDQRDKNRKLLSAAAVAGTFGIVFVMLGGWTAWMLAGNMYRPWTFAIELVLYGTDGLRKPKLVIPPGWRQYKRLMLVTYWIATITVAVAGWQTRLVRARRIKLKDGSTAKGEQKVPEKSRVGAEMAREEKRILASLNMRRKFFHGLAVIMFVPGIAFEPAFTSLAFSLAFAIFTFIEYARFFALYPVGAPLHIFFAEFLDSKDTGPVIISHFYLLTGCAGGLWLEGRSINRYTGVLVLGIGDALASIVGKLLGRVRWPGSNKTVEGTAAFVVSIVLSAWLLRVVGLAESFSLARYTVATTLAGLFEAFSQQNDNLVIPIYMWSLVSLLDC